MFQDYRIDERKLRAAVAAKGFATIGDFLKAAALHRNSLGEYLGGKKSVFSAVTRKMCAVLQCDPLTLLTSEPSIGTDDDAAILQKALERLANAYPSAAFFLLGSRAKGLAGRFSDWDIAVTGGPDGLAIDDYLSIKSELEDQTDNMSVGVDLINFDNAPRWFLSPIHYQPIFLAGERNSFAHALGVIHGANKS